MGACIYPDVEVLYLGEDGTIMRRFSQYVGHGLYLVFDYDFEGNYIPVYYCGNRFVNYIEVVELLERVKYI